MYNTTIYNGIKMCFVGYLLCFLSPHVEYRELYDSSRFQPAQMYKSHYMTKEEGNSSWECPLQISDIVLIIILLQ